MAGSDIQTCGHLRAGRRYLLSIRMAGASGIPVFTPDSGATTVSVGADFRPTDHLIMMARYVYTPSVTGMHLLQFTTAIGYPAAITVRPIQFWIEDVTP